jgi:hypothetical protein
MSDIVERLRAWVYTDSQYATAREAADEIERLRLSSRGDCPVPENAANQDTQPVAWQLWGDDTDDGPFDHFITARSAHYYAENLRREQPNKRWLVVPLYRHPPFTLTDAEREAVERAVNFCECTTSPLPTSDQIATLRALLQRTRG